MKYQNKRTGNVIIVPCRLEGPDWEEVTEAEKDAPKDQTPKAAPKKRTAKKGADA